MVSKKSSMPNSNSLDASIPVSKVSRKLPRGLNSLPKEVALEAQKIRIIEAIAQVVAEKGYASATVADVIRIACVSRTTFYELFKDKEDCYLSAFKILASANAKAVSDAIAKADSLPGQCVNALEAYIRELDENPTFAFAFIAQAEAASPAVREALDSATLHFTDALKFWFDEVRRLNPEVRKASEQTIQMLMVGIRSFASFRARFGAQAQGDSAVDLAVFTFAALGLYGWASKARDPSPQWGAPV